MNDGLPLKLKIGYGLGEINSSLFWAAIGFWLMNFLTDTAGLAAGLAGAAVMVGKVWDAVIDPLVGALSDRTRSRWGRRRPWLLFGALPFGAAFLAMFCAPRTASQAWLFVWAAGAYVLLCSACSIVVIPYNALLPELSSSFSERTRISGFKMGLGVLGTLIGAGAVLPILGLFPSRADGFMAVGGVFGLLIAASALSPFFAVREPARPQAEAPVRLLSSMAQAFRNRPFVLILSTWALNTVGLTVVTATLVYYFKYILNREGLMSPALACLLLASLAFIPVSVKMSERLGKRGQYLLGMSVVVAAVLFLFAFGHRLGLPWVFATMLLAGAGMSTHYVMPWSILPDALEYGYLRSGKREEGVHYGLLNFVIQVGQAVAGLLVGLVLAGFGYAAGIAQSPLALLGIRLLVGPMTALFFVAGIVVLAFYPISRERYERILEQIRARDARNSGN
jgi:GPH family glycoside/pentoside/hexuronide:cation symporter